LCTNRVNFPVFCPEKEFQLRKKKKTIIRHFQKKVAIKTEDQKASKAALI